MHVKLFDYGTESINQFHPYRS